MQEIENNQNDKPETLKDENVEPRENDIDASASESQKTKTPLLQSICDKQSVRHNKEKYFETTIAGDQAQAQVADCIVNINNYTGANIAESKGIKKISEFENPNVKASYLLHDVTQCAAFGEQFKDSIHFAYAIVMSVFDYVLIRLVDDLVKHLMVHLPTVTDEEGRARADRDAPFLALKSILSVIGGCEIETPEGLAVGFAENTAGVLRNIWFQYPSLRDSIVSWLLDINSQSNNRTDFELHQIVNAFVKLIKIDFTDAERRLFLPLASDPRNTNTLVLIALELYASCSTKKFIDSILHKWSQSPSNWHWKISCSTYALLSYDEKDDEYTKKLEDVLLPRFYTYDESICRYTGLSLLQSKRLRNAIVKVLEHYSKKAIEDEKHDLVMAIFYLELVRYAYYRVTSECPILPLVACDDPTQHTLLRPVLATILEEWSLREVLFAIIGAYLDEISTYNVNEQIKKALQAFFYNAALANPRFYQDIRRFLQNETNNIATEIDCFLSGHQKRFIEKKRLQ